ncbi:cupin domain-containing protein [Luteimicrobium sp. DT211]|uniref:cupin domain-containing protein n=1 Tax=Luteimicrobium sp. DT211 TaxID=3393412 RepID=UPI003CE9BDBB
MDRYELPSVAIDRFESVGVTMDFLPDAHASEAGQVTSVHVAHLAAGGTLGRHPATRRQIFAVVSGEARVASGDDGPVDLGPGQCAVWEPGEQHQTWAVTDVVAVVVETGGTVAPTVHHRTLPAANA